MKTCKKAFLFICHLRQIAYKIYLTEPFMDKKLYVNTAFMLEMAVMNLNKIQMNRL